MKFDHTMLLAVLGTMLVLGLVWFALIRVLFRRLESRHGAKYEAMGRPTLFLRNNLHTNLTTLKFLFAREHRSLGDPGLGRLADGMLAFTVLYVLLFIAIAAYAGLWANPGPRRFAP